MSEVCGIRYEVGALMYEVLVGKPNERKGR